MRTIVLALADAPRGAMVRATTLRTAIAEHTPWKNTLHSLPLLKMKIREILALNLKRFRRAQGVSQEELAYRADIDRTYVSLLERQKYGATVDVIAKLAEALGVEPHVLLKPPSKK